MVVADYLARSYRAKLLLTSRHGLPAGNQWSRLAASMSGNEKSEQLNRRIRQVESLERLGAEVMVAEADVTDLKAMQAAVDGAIARFGPIRGVIHSAGVPGGGVIERRTREAAEAVLAPKVTGTLVLDSIFKKRDLDFFLIFSSLNSIVGGFGQADYTAANSFLDAFAHYRSSRNRGLTATVNWDAWRETGMAADAARRKGGSTSQRATLSSSSLSQYRQLAHPLFTRFMLDEQGAEAYITRLGGPRSWVLNEYRVAGQPTLPETAYLELARAAYELHVSSIHAVELRDVVFTSPLTVPQGREIEVRTVLRRVGAGPECEFTIQSIPDPNRPQLREHARGRIATLSDSPLTRHDVERLIHSTPVIFNLNDHTARTRQRRIELGPRWQNLVQVRLGRGQGLAFLRLPEAFQDDCATFMLHPALLDTATGFVSMRSGTQYQPVSYRKVRILKPLHPCVYSYAAFEEQSEEGGKERLHINLTIMDIDGVVLIEIEDYVLGKVTK
jgi:NAD(P)-dependent dehydrogenase (short-subunit alcohol dehydrogenase family)